MSRTGQTLVDVPEATVRVLVDHPDLVLTYMRSRTEGGPGRHLHREHADGFIVLEGEYAFELGDERAPRGAGTAIVIPREVIHRYEHETTEQGQFLNIHAPGMGFGEYLFA
jgi:mannose-6-phosphate isomerase-like protein (cupin superfamily)